MRTIFSIAAHDLRRLYTNVMTGIVMVGLIALPCLFAWFNVLASWDPFGNTQRFQIAVANADEGFSSDILPLSVNAGDMTLSALARNDDMDWVITDQASAIDGAKSGEYYAAIVLPETLSRDMLTFYTGNAQPSPVSLYVNEKKNPISPLLVTSGSQGMNAQINESFTRVLSEVAFGFVDVLHGALNDADTQQALDSLQSRMEGIRDDMHSTADTVDSVAAMAESTVPLVDSASDIAESVRASFDSVEEADLGGLRDGIGGSAAAIGAALGATAQSMEPVQDQINKLLDAGSESTQATASTLEDLAARIDVSAAQYSEVRTTLSDVVQPALDDAGAHTIDAGVGSATAALDDAIARLNGLSDRLTDAANRLREGTGPAPDKTRAEIAGSVDKARDAIVNARGIFDTEIRPDIENITASLDELGVAVDDAKADLTGTINALENTPGSLRETLMSAGTKMNGIGDGLRDRAGDIDSALRTVHDAQASGDVDKLAELISGNPEELASALVSPITVDRHAVFPRDSFGTGLAPLYTVLALWVGALLTAVALRTDDESMVQKVRPQEKINSVQRFFGRYLTFAVTGLVQSTLVIGGLIIYVEVHPSHPLLLFVAGWISSLVFHLLCYTFVISFGSIGKALGVLLMVLQVSAAGGAYPLELLPNWAQAISPWLPATYSVTAMRAALFGTYDGDFTRALGILSLYVIPALLIGLVIRPLIAPLINQMNDAIEKTEVMQ